MTRTRATAALLIALSLGTAACSSDSDSSASTTTIAAPATSTAPVETDAPAETDAPTTEAATTEAVTTDLATTEAPTTDAPTTTEGPTTTATPKVLEVLVTNDDGYGAAGIDAVVEYLRSRPDVHVTVWAPLTNQSGTGDKATDGGATSITDVTTASGFPAKAVEGFPADSVNAALASGYTPDLVVSGSNLGQNYGPLTKVSGTVGAAATVARLGIPAIAISQGLPAEGASFDFPSSVAVLTEYLDGAIDAYRAGTGPALVSINVPTCPAGVALLPTLDIISAAGDNGRQLGAVTACDGNPANPVDDIDGFNAGHGVVSQLDPITLAGIAP